MNTNDNSKVIITRVELYDLVWVTPLVHLAKKYQISDSGLRKICKRLDIPLPNSGYWSKLKFNKPVKKIPLSKNSDVKQEIELLFRNNELTLGEHFQTKFYRLKNEIENTSGLILKVQNHLINPDPLIIAAQKDLKDKKPKRYFGNAKDIIYTSNGIIRIEVAKENILRSLCFMDTFIKLIKQRGHNIKFENGTYVLINGESIKVRFREILKRITTKHPKYDWNNSELIPSGLFLLN